MSVTTRTVGATPEEVWDVLCDGWLYPLWVLEALERLAYLVERRP